MNRKKQSMTNKDEEVEERLEISLGEEKDLNQDFPDKITVGLSRPGRGDLVQLSKAAGVTPQRYIRMLVTDALVIAFTKRCKKEERKRKKKQ